MAVWKSGADWGGPVVSSQARLKVRLAPHSSAKGLTADAQWVV